MDGKHLKASEKIKRHDLIEVPKNFELIKERFGENAAKEFLWHLKDDYSQAGFGTTLKVIGKIMKWF
jgi:hypothetical protein